jgi:hypothetical protein
MADGSHWPTAIEIIYSDAFPEHLTDIWNLPQLVVEV